MKPRLLVVLCCTAWCGLVAVEPVQAGWNSVFQLTCANCSTPTVSGFAPDPCCNPCPTPCPQQVCTTRYTQRCYYQPVTCYQTKTYYEPVTTYRTSYYYEPITCYRYSCCYDPCSCSYRQVAHAYTSYRLRSQCCPVTSWAQRCCKVPVTTYKKCCYWEPQTCCSLVDPCACKTTAASVPVPQARPVVPVGPVGPVGPVNPVVPSSPIVPTNPLVPSTSESHNPSLPYSPPPGGNGPTSSPLYNQYYTPPTQPLAPTNPMAPPHPEGSGSSFRPKSAPFVVPTQKPAAPVAPRLDRIAYDAAPAQANLVGQVLRDTQQPKSGARLVFVSEGSSGRQEVATTDPTGKFQARLASGTWLMYVQDTQGKSVFHSKLQVKSDQVQQMTLMSR
jgi:hypothetical protein